MKMLKWGALICIFWGVSACGSGFESQWQEKAPNSQESPPDSSPPPDDPPSSSWDIFRDVADPVGALVDRRYIAHQELLSRRRETQVSVDSCVPALKERDRFADGISYFVQEQMTPRKAKLRSIASIYKLPSDESKWEPTSFVSHAMCSVSVETLKETIGDRRVPSQAVIQKLNAFSEKHNQLRADVLAKKEGAEVKMMRLWSKLFMCLAYTESLTTADSEASERVAKKVAPSGYQKPPGVKFYEDPAQSGDSVLNIGLFQFAPVGSGNIHPCIYDWNERYPQCGMELGGSRSYFIERIGSGLQVFNGFCGVNKVQQMFTVQVNTTSSKHTHPHNRTSGSTLRDASNRCVSLHFSPGGSYTHFGPFMNSTGENLGSLMSCVLED